MQAVHTAPTSQFSPSNFILMGIAPEIATELQGSVNTDLIRRISKPKQTLKATASYVINMDTQTEAK